MAVDYSKALKCAILSQEVYQGFNQIKFSEFANLKPDLIEQADTDTQCAILSDTTNTCIYIIFRGSEKGTDWDTNFDFQQEVVDLKKEVIEEGIVEDKEQIYPYQGETRSGAKMHRGFVTAYFSVRDKVHDYVRSHPNSSITVTGHSLGGALATLCAVDIQYNFPKVKIEIYTFGAPRAGNEGFRESFNRRVPDSYRFVHGMDIVPALPRTWQGYRHVDAEYRLGQRFSLNFFTQRFKDHAIAKYIAALKEKIAK